MAMMRTSRKKFFDDEIVKSEDRSSGVHCNNASIEDSSIDAIKTKCTSEISHQINMAWYPQIRDAYQSSAASAAREFTPRLHYSRRFDEKSNAFTNAGTLYQFLCREDELTVKRDNARPREESKSTTESALIQSIIPRRFMSYQSRCRVSKFPDQQDKNAKYEVDFLHLLKDKASNMKWVRVTEERSMFNSTDRLGHTLNITPKAESVLASDPTIPDLGARFSFPNWTSVASQKASSCYVASMAKDISGMQLDYKQLALKIDLYDELRDHRIVQPSGVEYAWTKCEPPEKYIIPRNLLDEAMFYEAIFVSSDVCNNAFIYNEGKLCLPGDSKIPILFDPIVLIALNTPESSYARDAWIASHLPYPLAWVLDVFEMGQVGRSTTTREVFVRTAGLVDVTDRSDKFIIFMVPPGTQEVTIGGEHFGVYNSHMFHDSYDGLDNYPDNYKIEREFVLHDVTNALAKMAVNLIESPVSLRSEFSRYTEVYFPDGINWLEINIISSALTVRWHQRIESMRKKQCASEPAKSVGAPLSVLKAMGLQPNESIHEESYPGYGGNYAVTCFDQRVVSRECIFGSIGIVNMRPWRNVAEITICSGYLTAKRVDQNINGFLARMESGGWDRLIRGWHLRMAFEIWKSFYMVGDYIAFPDQLVLNRSLFFNNHLSLSQGMVIDAKSAVHVIATDFCKWKWHYNFQWQFESNPQCTQNTRKGILRRTVPIVSHRPPGSTLTGIRTVSAWRRNKINSEWDAHCICSGDEKIFSGDTYYLFGDRYYKVDYSQHDPVLEAALMRLDMQAHPWDLSYYTYPGGKELPAIAWVVDSSYGGFKAVEMGWPEGVSCGAKPDKWGWGVQVGVRDYLNQQLKTLIVSRSAYLAMTSNLIDPDTTQKLIRLTSHDRNFYISKCVLNLTQKKVEEALKQARNLSLYDG